MTQPVPITFGSYIAAARKKIPLSQKQLAERSSNTAKQLPHSWALRWRSSVPPLVRSSIVQ